MERLQKALTSQEDLEANRIPIHTHVEAEITKGKYHDYDNFLGPEAVLYLKLYLNQRREGFVNMPPEEITDQSPLIRDETRKDPRGIGPKALRKIVHMLYDKAGLLKPSTGRMYDLRAHSIRKYFKTQLLALGMQPDYADYMMGHDVDTYDNIQSLRVDKLRNIYAAAGLSIRPKTQTSKVEALKEIIRAWGMNPEQILARDALADGATTRRNQEEAENHQLAVLRNQLKQLIQKEATV